MSRMKHLLNWLYVLLSVFTFFKGYGNTNFIDYTTGFWINDIQREQDTLWIATDGGLVKLNLNNGSKDFYDAGNSGLTANKVLCIYIDSVGNKWMGLEQGVVRYDGSSWDAINVLASDTIRLVSKITGDKLGNIYIASNVNNSTLIGNLYRLTGNTCNKLPLPNGVGITSLAVDTLGRLWLGSTNFVARLDTAGLTVFDTTNSQFCYNCNHYVFVDQDSKINAIRVTPNGNNTIFTYDSIWNPVFGFNGLSGFDKVFCDYNNHLWFSGGTVFLEFDGNTVISHGANSYLHLPVSYVNCVYVDSSTGYWLGATYYADSLLFNGDGSTWQMVNISKTGLSSLRRERIFIDKLGNKWIAGESGIDKFNGITWTNYNPSNSPLNSYFTKCCFVDKNQNLWIGNETYQNIPSLYRFDGLNWTSFNLVNFTSNLSVYKVIEDSNGDIWAATDFGPYKFDGQNWLAPADLGLLDEMVFDMCVDKDGALWFAFLYGGVEKYENGSTWLYTQFNSGLPDNAVFGVYCDRQNVVWAVTNSGLGKYDGATWTNFSAQSPGGPQQPFAMVIDSRNNLWVSEELGLAKFDGNSWTHYTIYNSHVGFGALFMAIDAGDNIWMTDYSHGLNVFNENGITANYPAPIDNSNVSGRVYFDLNSDGHLNSGSEPGLAAQKIVVLPDSVSLYTSSMGNYYYSTDTGQQMLCYQPYYGWSLTSDSASYTINGDTLLHADLNFGAISTSTSDSVCVLLTSSGGRCDWPIYFWIDFANYGSSPISGSVTLDIYDSLEFVTALPLPYNSNTTVAVWGFSNLQPFEHRQIMATCMVPGFNQTLDSLRASAIVSYGSGLVAADSCFEEFSCSYDPNDKIVEPVGIGVEHYVAPTQELEYTVRFQNTGNDTAFNIVIADTLDVNLDVSTFQFLASNKDVVTEVKSNGLVEFKLKNALLPPAITNEVGSHGYVKYKIKPKGGLAEGTLVMNTGYIYFDYNPAIITNNTYNHLTYGLTLVNEIVSEEGYVLYPNPMSSYAILKLEHGINEKHVRICDLFGRILQQFITKDDLIAINRLDKVAGIYFFEVTGEGRSIKGKFIVD
ncbi:MAG: T9SS type A sorting domain-containing protein [Chitinophagales bacterium]